MRTRLIIGVCLLGLTLVLSPTLAQDSEPEIDDFVFVEKEPEPKNLNEVRKKIEYPAEAVEGDISGTVVARVLIDEEGEYVRHKIVKEIHPLLSSAVERQLPGLEFEPALQNGTPVMYWMNIPFPFRLVNEREDKIKELIESLTDSLTGDPENYVLWHKRGIQRTELGEYEDALTDFAESITLNPQKNKKKKGQNYEYLFYAQYAQAAVLAAQEKYEEAIAKYTMAIQTAAEMKAYDSAVQATVPTIYIDRGYANFIAELYDAADADYRWVLANHSEMECEVYPLLADVGLTQEDNEALVGIYDGLIKCSPENELLYYSRGFYKMESEQHAASIEDFQYVGEKSLRVELKIASFNQAGYAYLQLGKYEEALGEIQKALDINALNSLSYYYQGLVFHAQGKSEEGCTSVRRALSFGLDGDIREEAIAFMEEHCGGYEE